MTSKKFEAAIDDFKLGLGLLIRRMRAANPSEHHELSWTQTSVMARLEKDGLMTAAKLARAEGVKPQSMAAALAQLEEMGLIEKKAHLTDGRLINIKLSQKGLTVRKSGKDASRAWLIAAFSRLNEKEQATLFKAGQIIRRLAEQ